MWKPFPPCYILYNNYLLRPVIFIEWIYNKIKHKNLNNGDSNN